MKKREVELPERLQWLNRELAMERTKDFENSYATRGEYWFKVSIFRNRGGGFKATCRVAGRVQGYYGATPDQTYLMLANACFAYSSPAAGIRKGIVKDRTCRISFANGVKLNNRNFYGIFYHNGKRHGET
ncbi:hypothetical protein BH10ACI2_BH10ACI2_00200 [soil metagenome]